MEKKEMQVTLITEPKTFTQKDSGQVIDYLDCSLLINNVVVKITIQKDSKRLFKYLMQGK